MIEAEPCLRADNQQIERVGHSGFEMHAAPCGEAREDDVGATPAQDEGSNQKHQSNGGRPNKELAPLEEQPTERDKR